VLVLLLAAASACGVLLTTSDDPPPEDVGRDAEAEEASAPEPEAGVEASIDVEAPADEPQCDPPCSPEQRCTDAGCRICVDIGAPCESNEDCCKGKCSGGRCDLLCRQEGAVCDPVGAVPCCPGLECKNLMCQRP